MMNICGKCPNKAVYPATAAVTGVPLCQFHYREQDLELSRLGRHIPRAVVQRLDAPMVPLRPCKLPKRANYSAPLPQPAKAA